MLRATMHKGKTGKVRHEGIVADAQALGVGREHLWYVLTGKRESRSLLRRYRALKKEASRAE